MSKSESEVKGEVAVATPTTTVYPASSLPMAVETLHQRPAIYTTLDTNDPQCKADLYDMIVDGGTNAKDFINRSFEIEDIVVHPITIANKETGELQQLPRIILRTGEGEFIQFVSQGIWSCLVMMKDLGWKPFGTTPQRFTLKAIPLDGGKQLYKLVREKTQPAKKAK